MTTWQYVGISLVILIASIMVIFNRRSVDKQIFCNKHVLITGGSSGLGRAVAIELAKKGASITLIARGTDLLEESKVLVKDYLAKGQFVNIISADVTKAEMAAEAVKKAESQSGRPVEMVFCCAGAAKPGFFLDQTPQIFNDQMQLNYMGVINVLQPTIKRMVEMGLKGGRVVMISSTVGLMGMIGYSPYSPTKFALRGLAESLRQELLPHGIKVHVYFVATIKSPGEERENLTKPEITKILEEGDVSDGSPEARAKVLIDGVERDYFSISSDYITELFRACSLGMLPSNNFLFESVLTGVGRIFLPLWQRYADYKVLKHAQK